MWLHNAWGRASAFVVKKYIRLYFLRKWPIVSLAKTLIPWLGLCRALWTAIWIFNPLATIEAHYMGKNSVMFSSKTFIYFSTEERKTWTSWVTWQWVNYQDIFILEVSFSFNKIIAPHKWRTNLTFILSISPLGKNRSRPTSFLNKKHHISKLKKKKSPLSTNDKYELTLASQSWTFSLDLWHSCLYKTSWKTEQTTHVMQCSEMTTQFNNIVYLERCKLNYWIIEHFSSGKTVYSIGNMYSVAGHEVLLLHWIIRQYQ